MALRHKALRFGVPEAVVLLCLGAGAVLVLGPRPAAKRAVAREEQALALVRETAKAEHDFVGRRVKDVNGDSAFEYGSLADLSAAGLVSRPIASDATGSYVTAGGYRVEVLLPSGVDGARRVTLARSGGRPDPAYAAQFFAVVATPRRGEESGLRSFYLDADGRLYEAEGVSDAGGDPYGPPPSRVITEAEENRDAEGPLWRLSRGPPPMHRK